MQEKNRKFPLTWLEIVCLAILIPIVLGAGIWYLGKPMNYYAPSLFYTALGPLAVLGFDIVWVIMMRLWPLKNVKVKIALTLLVLTLSASVISCWAILNSLAGSW